jgi:molybdopterin synthase sulfur carrier subunit
MEASMADHQITLRYFAWVRERIGQAEESIAVPDGITTVGDLIGWLRDRGSQYAHAFEKPSAIRAAIDKSHVKHDAPIAGAREIALFPPVTGG